MKSKRLKQLRADVDKQKLYSIDEAIEFVKSHSNAKFTESVEIHVRVGIDPKKGDQQIRISTILPHGTGKTKRIAVFAPEGSTFEKEAKELGADFVLTHADIEKIKQTGSIDFDIAVAVPDMMRDLAKIARILGPRGLMPSPKNETVTTDLKKTIHELKSGKITIKNDDTSNIHQLIGNVKFTNDQLKENVLNFFDTLKRAKPSSSKGTFLKSATICSTMGPSVKIQIPA